ncbi:hypothetical protein HNR23_004673 [Nocardiopsis mwathae]|uniref:Uncharacterized protein n=1 Tax=Nocardiopsis mwathae TaxID=1472723 RepID=A0A7W9YLZ5_9ACTN|nr:hypothetical protein [Nocardiopsis mwathae]MBB6174613.1 hypothetical protein [Nocardiopsis mwathae]
MGLERSDKTEVKDVRIPGVAAEPSLWFDRSLSDLSDLSDLLVVEGTGATHDGVGAPVVGVEPDAGADTRKSLSAGERVRIPAPTTIADGLRHTTPAQVPFAIPDTGAVARRGRKACSGCLSVRLER